MMTVVRELHEVTEGTSTPRKWIRPSVQQLAAGSAEDSSGPATDSITNPS